MRGIPEGHYELQVVTSYGDIVKREFVSVHEHQGVLLLKLPERKGQQPASGTVSVKALLSPVPEKARKEFQKADAAFTAGRIEDSIRHLEKAVRIHPAYLEAHNNLGVRYVRRNDFALAASHFRRAADIDPESALSQTNLALALISLKQHREAELAARRALALDPRHVEANYALGLSLAAQHNCVTEAVDNLKKASGRFPRAHLGAARILACRGELSEAASQLAAYLDTPGVPYRREVEAWLAQLKRSGRQ